MIEMKKALSTHLFVQEPLTTEVLESIRAAGFEGTELFAVKPHFDYGNQRQMNDLASWFSDHASFLQSIHTPFCVDYQAGANREWLSIGDPERVRRQIAIDAIRWTLELAERVPLPHAVVHMGTPDDRHTAKHLDAIYYSLETLVPFAEARGTRLLLENIPNGLSRIERMRRFLEDAHLERVGLCFDSGHAHLNASVEGEIRDGGPWIIATHLHDNYGVRDEHLLPFEGSIDWLKVLQAFEATSYQGSWTLEVKAGNRSSEGALKQAFHCFDRFQECQEELLEMKMREE